MRPHKFEFNTFRELIENCIWFLKMESNQKKTLKSAFLVFFRDISGENLNETVTAQYFASML